MTLPVVAAAGLLAVVAALTVVWAVSVRLHDVSVVDICWGLGFVLLVWLYVGLFDSVTARPLLLASLVTLWGGRLALHIYGRHRGKGEDARYRAMREARGPSFWWRSLFVVFWLQGGLLWFIALPLLFAAGAPGPDGMLASDVIGLALFAVGFTFEAVGDYQLTRFKTIPANSGKVLDSGLWRYTRHPNYFGDALLWWGLFVVATAAPGGWWTIASPMLMTWLLMRVSGVTLLERRLTDSKPGYADYIRRTSAFVPWFPSTAE